jgi:SAM-dependent methyltransferase
MMPYSRWARYYDALHVFKDYDAESQRLVALVDRLRPDARTLLDVACGTGRHLERLRTRFDVEGLDINPDLLAVARERCPDLRLHHASMEDFDLGRRFDVVTCLFTSIAFLRTRERMSAAVAAMARHLEPGGVLLVEPWYSPDRCWSGTINGHWLDRPDLKIAWMYTARTEGELSVMDNRFLVGTADGFETFEEQHVFAMFTAADFEAAFAAAGLTRVPHDDPAWYRGLYVATAGVGADGC